MLLCFFLKATASKAVSPGETSKLYLCCLHAKRMELFSNVAFQFFNFRRVVYVLSNGKFLQFGVL